MISHRIESCPFATFDPFDTQEAVIGYRAMARHFVICITHDAHGQFLEVVEGMTHVRFFFLMGLGFPSKWIQMVKCNWRGNSLANSVHIV